MTILAPLSRYERRMKDFRVEFENFPPMGVSATNKEHAQRIAEATIKGEKVTRVIEKKGRS